MRLLPALLVCILSSAAIAADAVPAHKAHSITNPIDALKKSLHKEDAPKVVAKKRAPVVKTWMSLPHAQRESVLSDWLALPETTRPPFPVYRDACLEGDCKTAVMGVAPHADAAIKKSVAK